MHNLTGSRLSERLAFGSKSTCCWKLLPGMFCWTMCFTRCYIYYTWSHEHTVLEVVDWWKPNFMFQINLGIYLRDKSKEFSILVDRAVGGSSIIDGQLELMVHRFVIMFFKFNCLCSFCIIPYSTNQTPLFPIFFFFYIGGYLRMIPEVLERHWMKQFVSMISALD